MEEFVGGRLWGFGFQPHLCPPKKTRIGIIIPNSRKVVTVLICQLLHLNSKGIPYPDKLGRSIKLIKELTQKDFPKTMLEINSKGEITKKKG